MPSDAERRALSTIRDNITLAISFVGDRTGAQFREDRMAFYAATRSLEIISEASRRLSQEMKDRPPELPWAGIAGAGNVYRHEYDNVLESYVWRTVRDSLPALLEAVEQELKTSST